MYNKSPKPKIMQNTTFIALGFFGWAIYNFITGNLSAGATAMLATIGLLFAADN
jgi:hypothetical protein